MQVNSSRNTNMKNCFTCYDGGDLYISRRLITLVLMQIFQVSLIWKKFQSCRLKNGNQPNVFDFRTYTINADRFLIFSQFQDIFVFFTFSFSFTFLTTVYLRACERLKPPDFPGRRLNFRADQCVSISTQFSKCKYSAVALRLTNFRLTWLTQEASNQAAKQNKLFFKWFLFSIKWGKIKEYYK